MNVYERFTDRARKVMQLANQEAQRFNHEYIRTAHILLGLCKEGSGMAASVLENAGIDLRKIRLEVEKLVQSGPDTTATARLPQTPRAKKVIEYSLEEARNLNHLYVGTEHILLGLIREQDGVAAQVLLNLGIKLEDARNNVLILSGQRDIADAADEAIEEVRGPTTVQGGGGLLEPLWVPKNWGGETWFANDETSEYCGKKLFIIGGKRNSWHYHKTKDEVLFVNSGELQLRYAPMERQQLMEDNPAFARVIDLHPGQAFHVPATMRHQLCGTTTCWIIEASTVDLPGDTVRLLEGN